MKLLLVRLFFSFLISFIFLDFLAYHPAYALFDCYVDPVNAIAAVACPSSAQAVCPPGYPYIGESYTAPPDQGGSPTNYCNLAGFTGLCCAATRCEFQGGQCGDARNPPPNGYYYPGDTNLDSICQTDHENDWDICFLPNGGNPGGPGGNVCPQANDAKTYSTGGHCDSSTGLGYNTVGGGYTCGPVACPGDNSGQNNHGHTCMYSRSNGQGCDTGYGGIGPDGNVGAGYNPSNSTEGGCTFDPNTSGIGVSCPQQNYVISTKVKDGSGNPVGNIALTVYDNGHGNYTITTDPTTGIATFKSWSGDHFKVWPQANANYTFNVSQGNPITGFVNTSGSCGTQLGWPNAGSQGTDAACSITATAIATNTISGKVYVDYDHNNSEDGSDSNFINQTNAQVTDGTHTVNLDASGNFSFTNDEPNGTVTISLVNPLPAGYGAVIASQQITVNNADVNNAALSVTPLFTISGLVYNDNGQNGSYDTPGDTPYTDGTSKFTLSGGPTSLPESDSNAGTFSFAPIESGTYTISYTSLPSGYTLTYPLSGNPPSFQVTVGTPGKSSAAYECDTKGVHNAVCDGVGSISGVDFGITNESSIIQTTCGDTRFDGGYSQVIPSTASCGGTSGPYAIVQNPALCPTSPGILFSGSTDPNYGGTGASASTSNYVVGDTSFPEQFTPRIPNSIGSSYSFVMTTINNLSVPPTPLTSICPTLDCDLSQINPGVYTTQKGDGNVTFYVSNPSFTLNPGSYTFVIGDDITFTSKVLLQSGQAASFISGGNIHVTGDVTQGNAGEVGETTWTSTNADLDGFYSADGSFSVDRIDNSAPVCNNDGSPIDKKLNIVGTVITNAGESGGSLVNNRNGCVESLSCPVVSVRQDPLQILHAPGPLKPPYTFWQELNP